MQRRYEGEGAAVSEQDQNGSKCRNEGMAELDHQTGILTGAPSCIHSTGMGRVPWAGSPQVCGEDLPVSRHMPADPQKTDRSEEEETSCCWSMRAHLALQLGGSSSG